MTPKECLASHFSLPEYKVWQDDSGKKYNSFPETSVRLESGKTDQDGNIASGKRENITWKIDADGKLSVSGTGNWRKSGYGDSAPWWSVCYEIKSVEMDWSEATDVSYMFSGCANLTSVDFSGFDASEVTNMEGMLAGCCSLASIIWGDDFDTSKVTNMKSMFSGCESLEYLDLSTFNTSSVTSLQDMFYECSKLKTLNLGQNFDTSNVTNTASMFCSCSSLEKLDLGNSFNTSNVTSAYSMFDGCTNLVSLELGPNFDTSKCEEMSLMFAHCPSLTTLSLGEKFNTSSVTTMCGMFDGCSGLVTLNLGSNFDTSKVENMSEMFFNCSSLPKIEFGDKFDTSAVSEMRDMFRGCSSLTELDLSSFNTSSLTNMWSMFTDCTNLKTLNFGSKFDTSKVTDYSQIFSGCTGLEELDLSSFTIVGGLNIYSFFAYNAEKLTVIITPKECLSDIYLPTNFGTWKDNKGNIYTKLPSTSKKISTKEIAPDPTAGDDYVIDYELNGGTNSKENPATYKDGKTVTLKNPKKDGYTFGGWYDNAEFSGDKITTVKGKDITVYAKWTANTYTITLNGNGGKYTPEGGKTTSTLKMNTTYDVSAVLSNPFARTGYTLTGWTTKKDGKGTFYAADAEVINLTKTNKANVNLYAKWEANAYTVFFDINASEVYEGDLGGEMLPVTVKYGKSVKLPANKLTRKGYTFKGWSTDLDDKVNFKNKASVKNLAVSGNVTLYAVWSINTYSVKYNANGGKGKAPAAVKGLQYGEKTFKTAVNPFTNKECYTFKGWNTKKDGSGEFYDEDIDANLVATKNKQAFTLYATWAYEFDIVLSESEKATYPAYFNQSVKAEKITEDIPALVKTGEYIAGFANSEANATKGKMAYKGTVKNAAGKTLYPVYKANKYTIKFDANGGTGKMKSVSAMYDKPVTLPKNVFKNGSKPFLGWATSKTPTYIEYGNKAVVSKLTDENKGVVTLYAIWEEPTVYNLEEFEEIQAGLSSYDSVSTGQNEIFIVSKDGKRGAIDFEGNIIVPISYSNNRWQAANDLGYFKLTNDSNTSFLFNSKGEVIDQINCNDTTGMSLFENCYCKYQSIQSYTFNEEPVNDYQIDYYKYSGEKIVSTKQYGLYWPSFAGSNGEGVVISDDTLLESANTSIGLFKVKTRYGLIDNNLNCIWSNIEKEQTADYSSYLGSLKRFYPAGAMTKGYYISYVSIQQNEMLLCDSNHNVVAEIALYSYYLEDNKIKKSPDYDPDFFSHDFFMTECTSSLNPSSVYNYGTKMIWKTQSGKYALVDLSTGSPVALCTYDLIDFCDGDIILVSKNGKWGYVDVNGKEIKMFDDASNFYHGYAGVVKDGKGYILNEKMEVVYETGDAESVSSSKDALRFINGSSSKFYLVNKATE